MSKTAIINTTNLADAIIRKRVSDAKTYSKASCDLAWLVLLSLDTSTRLQVMNDLKRANLRLWTELYDHFDDVLKEALNVV